MAPHRLRRAIRLLRLLHQSEGLSQRELARWLDCSQRTVYRDLELLKDSGFEVVWAPGGYRLDSGDELPRATLDDQEMMALLAALDSSPLLRRSPPRTQVHQALEKLMAGCSEATRARWQAITRHQQRSPYRDPTTEPLSSVLDKLMVALEKQAPVAVDYLAGDSGRAASLNFIPERIVATASGWTVQGRETGTRRSLSLDVHSIRIRQMNRPSTSTPCSGGAGPLEP
jgi:predicted DNA-binding transcriptional regulator YafY